MSSSVEPRDLDLIPGSYHRAARQRRQLVQIGIALVACLCTVGTLRLALGYGIHRERRAVESLRQQQSDAINQNARVEALRGREKDLRRRLNVLRTLRGATPARRMFRVVDRALDGSVWFLDWQFRRAGELMHTKPKAEKAGYFIVVPAEAEDGSERAWRVDTHMEIRAQALDHASLAGFVRRLVSLPEIEDARILSTRVRDPSSPIVDFELAVVVRSHA